MTTGRELEGSGQLMGVLGRIAPSLDGRSGPPRLLFTEWMNCRETDKKLKKTFFVAWMAAERRDKKFLKDICRQGRRPSL